MSGGIVMVNTLAMRTPLSAPLVQYIVPASLFQLVSVGADFCKIWRVETRPAASPQTGGKLRLDRQPSLLSLPLWRDKFRLSSGLQLKGVLRKFLLVLYIRILRQAVVSTRFKPLLLH